MFAAERVAAPAVIQVAAPFVQHVEKRVVDAPEVVGPAVVTPFGGVVEDDIEVDLDPGLVERLDHLAELFPGLALFEMVGIRRLRGAEGDRVVSPEVPQGFAGHWVDKCAVVLIELVHGKELDGRDPQGLQVIDLLGEAQIRPGMRDSGVRVDGVPANVELVDDRVFQKRAWIDPALATRPANRS